MSAQTGEWEPGDNRALVNHTNQYRAIWDLNEQAIATPTVANRRLYVRTMGMLYCFGL